MDGSILRDDSYCFFASFFLPIANNDQILYKIMFDSLVVFQVMIRVIAKIAIGIVLTIKAKIDTSIANCVEVCNAMLFMSITKHAISFQIINYEKT